MNEQEKREYVFAQLSSLPNAYQYVEVTNYIEKLEKEKQVLQNRIDKAIKLIEEIQNFPHTNINQHKDMKELKDILKESGE